MIFERKNKIIVFWLWLGFAMILIQILLGGITRLTGSGLSITKWDIVTGIVFPVGEQKWIYYFDLYKQTPQFQKINQDMNLEQFKFIFFWEYFHRLWARLMGLVFVIPFLFFLFKKWLDKTAIKRLIIVVLLAAFVASLGWIMVASGLTQRPWVNAYKLSFHLLAAVLLLSYLYYTIIKTQEVFSIKSRPKEINGLLLILIFLTVFQIFLGGVMAGMKAGLAAPTWPKIQGNWIPDQIYQLTSISNYLFTEYEISHTGPVVVQFFHRSVAYLIFALIIWFCYSVFKWSNRVQWNVLGLLMICLFQVFIGIWTVIHCIGYIPLWPAVIHQLFGILLLIYILGLYFRFELVKTNNHG